MKRSPNPEELSSAVVALGPLVQSEVEALLRAGGPAKVAEDIDGMRDRLRVRFAALVTAGTLPDLDWPEMQLEHDTDKGALAIHFGERSRPETPEEREARIKGSAAAMWSMMSDAIAEQHPRHLTPPCVNVSRGLAIYAALVVSGMDRGEAMAAAAWQALTHDCNKGGGAEHKRLAH